MTRYETIFIVNPDLSEEQHKPLFDKLTGLVPDGQGLFVNLDEWGHKRLAYEVKKHTRGYYVLMDFCGDGALVKEIERNLRLDDRVIKYMTVLKDKFVDPDVLTAEIEAARADKAAKAAEAVKQQEAAKEQEAAEAAKEQEAAEAAKQQEAAEAAKQQETEPEPAEEVTSEGEEKGGSEETPTQDTASEPGEPEKAGESELAEEAEAPEDKTDVSETGEETHGKD